MSDAPSAFPPDLKPKWQERFAFFEEYGAPNTPEFKAAFKALPWRKRVLINMNFFAFFFGPIYMLILGMWKQALTLLGVLLLFLVLVGVIGAILILNGSYLPDAVDKGLAFAMSLMFGITANYSYYLKTVKGYSGWNPFRGMRW